MESKRKQSSTDTKSVKNRNDSSFTQLKTMTSKAHFHVQSNFISDIESRTRSKRESIASKVYEISQDEEFKRTEPSEFEPIAENNTDTLGSLLPLKPVDEIYETLPQSRSTHRSLTRTRPNSHDKPKDKYEQIIGMSSQINGDQTSRRREGLSQTNQLSSHAGHISRRRESLSQTNQVSSHAGHMSRRRESLSQTNQVSSHAGHMSRKRESLSQTNQVLSHAGQISRRRESLSQTNQLPANASHISKRRESVPLDLHGNRKEFHNHIDLKRRRGSHHVGYAVKDGETRKRVSLPKVFVKHLNTNRPKLKTIAKVVIICNLLHKYKSGEEKNKDDDDEVSPYIKGLHFHDFEDPVDLLFDRSKFKANKSVRIPEETKRILCKRSKDRTEHEIYTANIALRNIKAISEYPAAMQRKIVQVGQYESYEAKRILLRQGHPPSAFYFILSGQAVIMKMDDSFDYARPVRHMKKGDEFGDIALVHMSRRAATVICKEPCEFLSIGKKDFYKIFMSGGEKSIDDKDQENFLKGVSVLEGWPTEKLKEHQEKTKFLYYKRGEVIAPETNLFDNLIIVKSGSIQILKKLKRVSPFEWKKKKPEVEFVSEKEKRDNKTKRDVFRRHILSELRVPIRNADIDDNVIEEYPGKAKPFIHPSEIHPSKEQPNDIYDSREGKFNKFQSIEETYLQRISESEYCDENGKKKGKRRSRFKTFDKRRESEIEAERELMGFEEENRTAKHEITDKGLKRKDPDDLTAADLNPEFVHVKTLEKGQYIGIPESILEHQSNFCIVSNGADCILIDKHLYMEYAPEKLKNKLRSEECPFPTDEELQKQLQDVIDWESYRKDAIRDTLKQLTKQRQLRHALTI